MGKMLRLQYNSAFLSRIRIRTRQPDFTRAGSSIMYVCRSRKSATLHLHYMQTYLSAWASVPYSVPS